MKKLLFMFSAFFCISFSIAQASNWSFLDQVQKELFWGKTLSIDEEVKLLQLSSEAPRSVVTSDTNKQETTQKILVTDNDKNIETIKIAKRSRARRNYRHFQQLQKPTPFYTRRPYRMISEASMKIIRRKDQIARQKLLRYRAIFPAYGN